MGVAWHGKTPESNKKVQIKPQKSVSLRMGVAWPVTSVSFVCSSRSVLSSTCQEDKSVFANSDSFPNLELTMDRWLGGIFQSYHITRDKTLI